MHASCQRFRASAALSIDGELSQLEALALSQHLERCPPCEAFVASVEGFTRELRQAEFERYSPRLSSLPRRRFRAEGALRHSLAGAAAVASVAAMTLLTIDAFERVQGRPDLPRALPLLVIDASGADTARETQAFLRELRDVSLARDVGGPQAALPERPGIQVG